ncbi:alpha-ribazole phosphatase [Burkholderia oklahomensis]|uniref:Alpha-ribazole phosphatase n=2 Tax=Burkholderia oklahomensis TaxID=342113 RepID=A0AAI8FLL0_9BURK|nr:alpha-ribazole phosphatase [Burkholderia oklahomensis]AIO65611.1 alpha-ribazole phosphatase [Burkholderia oklahomensis]AOI43204.1 alpha-ribazole phosphatase [Burkholderia oklahomensis EO147]KUY57776.1 alpha-ribazole phosphatase [Burkholderia oklahomensis EO147]QPS37947.1 alpha-ribazole phosphatase [Burkholderia oklahomensis]
MDLVLIRHPAVAVEAGVCYGSSDVPLAADAAAGAAGIARRLRALGAARASRVWSSPLARCAELARVLADDARAPVEIDPRLSEIDFGAWEMKRWDEIGRDALDRWSADLMHAREHGGESAAQFVARVRPALAAFAASERASWVVTHAGVMRALAAHALDASLETMLARPVAMGGVVWLRRDEGIGEWRLVHWDE